jgi:hypothetical protein
MSQPKYAPMTATLLARKGAAGPSQMFGGTNGAVRPESPPPAAAPSPAAPILWLADLSTPASPAEDLESLKARRDGDRPHKVRVSLSDVEFEKFGIAAVKRGATRHQLLREALNSYVDRLMQDFNESCPCLGGIPTANGCCRD